MFRSIAELAADANDEDGTVSLADRILALFRREVGVLAAQFLAMDEYRRQALGVLHDQGLAITDSRRADFDRLLLEEFKTSTDSVAIQMRSAIEEPNDTVLLQNAKVWYGQRQ